jgi:hypothetical protein
MLHGIFLFAAPSLAIVAAEFNKNSSRRGFTLRGTRLSCRTSLRNPQTPREKTSTFVHTENYASFAENGEFAY